MRARGLWLLILFLALPGAMLAPAWNNYGLGANEDDLLYYLPTRMFFARSVAAGELPLFNPHNGLGRPYLADPQTAIFYPFTWLFPLAYMTAPADNAEKAVFVAYGAHLWFHHVIALAGAYRLMRSLGFRRIAAVFGAMVFGFCGFLLAHRNHLSMHAAAAWTPWLFWAQHRLLLTSSGPTSPAVIASRTAVFALLGAMQAFAGHPPMVFLTFIGLAVWTLAWRFWPASPSDDSAPNAPAADPDSATAEIPVVDTSGAAPPLPAPVFNAFNRPPLPIVLVRLVPAWLAVLGLFAVQWFPTLKYARLCERSDWSYAEFTENSLEPASLLLFLFPFLYGQQTPNAMGGAWWGPSHQSEQTGFVGVVALILALYACRIPWRNRGGRRPWIALLFFAFLMGLGRYGPICPLLYWLPGSSMFRCPARALLLVDLALAVLAASVVDDLCRGLSPVRSRLRSALNAVTQNSIPSGLLVALPPIVAVLLALPWLAPDTRTAALHSLRPTNPSLLVAIGSTVIALLAIGWVSRRWKSREAPLLLVAACAFELGFVGWHIYRPAEPILIDQVLRPESTQWLAWIRDDRRLWIATTRGVGEKPGEYVDSRAKSVAQTNLLERERFDLLTDYGPLQPRLFARSFAFEPWGESRRAAELLADTSWATAANVGWVLLTDERLPTPSDAVFVGHTSPRGDVLYQLLHNGAFASLEDSATPAALTTQWTSPNRFEIELALTEPVPAQTSALRISLLDLPGWTCVSGGRVARPLQAGESAHDMYLRVELDEKPTTPIVCEYRPPGLREGAMISGATLALLLGLGLFGRLPEPPANPTVSPRPTRTNRPAALPPR